MRQGEPLSAYLFNAVIDMGLSALDPAVGVEYSGCRVKALAYADDVVLLASTPEGLQDLMMTYFDNLAKGVYVSIKWSCQEVVCQPESISLCGRATCSCIICQSGI